VSPADKRAIAHGWWSECGVLQYSEPAPSARLLVHGTAKPVNQTHQSSGLSILLTLGILATPRAESRRSWLRTHMRSMALAESTEYAFVFGSKRVLSAVAEMRLSAERRKHGDILDVSARDYKPYAVAEKSLAWLMYAAKNMPHSTFIAKADDDTILHVSNLVLDLTALHAQAHYIYFGVLRWRLWDATQPNGACGSRSDGSPPMNDAKLVYRRLVREAGNGRCPADSIGPYLFSDGSLGVFSSALLVAIARSSAAHRFRSLGNRNGSQAWLHEDAGIGYLVYNTSVEQQLPTAFVTLSSWAQCRYWIELQDASTFPDADTMFVHRVKDWPEAYATQRCMLERRQKAAEFVMRDCVEDWGWKVAPRGASCFNKRSTEPFPCDWACRNHLRLSKRRKGLGGRKKRAGSRA